MNVVGIDPGFSGAIARVGDEQPMVVDMPVIVTEKARKKGKPGKKTCLNRIGILNTLRYFKETSVDLVVIEKQQAYPGQGAVSNFTTGAGYESLLMALDAVGLRYEVVPPKTWQKHFGLSGGLKGKSCQTAQQLFPEVELYTKRGRELDGRAEALLIAEYGRRKLQAEV